MFKRLNEIAQSLIGYYGLWPLVGGSAMMGAAFVWFAHVTKALQSWAPLSWAVVGMGGALSFVLILLGGALFRDAVISAGIKRRFYEETPRLNPLQKTFENVRIKIEDLRPPLGYIIKDRNFIDCEIVGPSNIAFLKGCNISNNSMHKCDNIIVNSKNVQVQTGMAFENCAFRNCSFYLCTFLVWIDMASDFEKGVQNDVWLTDPRGLTKFTNPPTSPPAIPAQSTPPEKTTPQTPPSPASP